MYKRNVSIGIVVPFVNCLKYTQQVFESLHTQYRHEWIFIDNGSTDGSEEWIKSLKQKNIVYLKQGENIGVARSWNLGMITAFERGHELVFVLNNDIVFAPDTVDNLVSWYGLESDELFEFITVTNIGSDPESLKDHKRRKEFAETPQFIGFMTNARTTKRVGYFDEGFVQGYFEDNDYHQRMKEEGIKAVCCLDALVSHYGSRTIKEGGVDHEATFIRNRVRFKKKWGFYPELGQTEPSKTVVRKVLPKLLWIGDAVVPTGFARVTHNVLNYLMDEWDVYVLGLNYRGDPHTYPYPIYPAITGGDVYGAGRFKKIIDSVQPNIICAINDPWVINKYVNRMEDCTVPFVSYIPVDSPNQMFASFMNKLDFVIFYTKFGRREFIKGGYTGESCIVPHGVDSNLYRGVDKKYARKSFHLAEEHINGFIFGNVNRNQPRKRLDLTIQAFAQWIAQYNPPDDVFLYLHAVNLDQGWDLMQLADYYNVIERLIMPGPELTTWNGIREEKMHLVYSMLDVQLSTTLGEGWGLSNFEGMSCGIPQIIPEWSALKEWAMGAARLVPCSHTQVTPDRVNTIGGVVDVDLFVAAMQELYESKQLREEYGKLALDRVNQECYRWSDVADNFNMTLQHVLQKREEAKENIPNLKEEVTPIQMEDMVAANG